ncbi:MAG TPA: ABC transporter permease subunit [Candidatus Limnocylindrales bacterium]|nr:ABC transporter permease subunit [Candidatus Limnocylindrales bacterium]
MTTENPPLAPAPAAAPRRKGDETAIPARRERSVPHAGWMVVAGKEFADQLRSVRFFVLLIVLGIAAIIPMYFTADAIRSQASSITDRSSLFLALFAYSPNAAGTGVQIPAAADFIRIVGPLLGVAFAFDAVNGERAGGTLPRLMSQPIHRDDVINGKFVAALAIIGLVFVVVVGVIAAFGIIRLGIAPTAEEVVRLLVWVVMTFLYVAIWVAFGILLSVLIRSSATSALVGFGVWIVLTIFGGLITQFVAGFIAPVSGTLDQQASATALQQTITRLNPSTLHYEASLALLNPQVAAVSNPATIAGYQQAAQRIPSLQSFEQSLLLVWPHFVTMLAITAALFAIAYIRFMRQEVRA